MCQALIPYKPFWANFDQNQKDDTKLQIQFLSLADHISDLSLKVFIPIQRLIPSRHEPKIFSGHLPNRVMLSNSLKYFSGSQDLNCLTSVINLIRSFEDGNKRIFLQSVSKLFDSLSVYNGSMTDRNKDIFPWKMLSYLNHCLKVFANEYPGLLNVLEEKITLALLKSIPFLEKILECEKVKEQIEYLEMKQIELLIRKFYQIKDEKPQLKENPSLWGFSSILNFEEIRNFDEIKKRKVLSHKEKIELGQKICQQLFEDDITIQEQVNNSKEVISFNKELETLKQKVQKLQEEIEQLAKKSPFRKVNKQIEAFYELENLTIVYSVGKQLFEDISLIPQKEKPFTNLAFIQLITLLREATHLFISDLNLNLKMNSIRPLVNRLKTIRNFFEHPEDYFFKTGSGQKKLQIKEFEKLRDALRFDLEKILSLFKKRIDKINKLIEPHLHKNPEDILDALAYRDDEKHAVSEKAAKRNAFKQEAQHSLAKEAFLENFQTIEAFSSRVMRKTEFWGLKEEEKKKLKPSLYDPFPRNVDHESSYPVNKLTESIERLKQQLQNINRKNFELRLIKEVPFRLTVQREVSEIYRRMEDFFDHIKKVKLPKNCPISYKHLENSYYAIKDVRNFQTHDLWRDNFKGIVNTAYLIIFDFSEMLRMITNNEVACTENSLEHDIIQKICFRELSIKQLEVALTEGLKINAFDYKGRNLLHFLAVNPSPTNFEIAKRLIKLGINIHQAECTLMRPLHFTCESGFYDLAEWLIKKGAVADLNSTAGTPLEIAQSHEHHEVAKLISSEVGMSKGGEARALLDAVNSLDIETMQQLIADGADASLDCEGSLPLVSLFRKEWSQPNLLIEAAQVLLSGGAYIDQPEPSTGDTPLHSASMYINDVSVMNFLMGLKPNVNLLNKSNHLPLHHAITVHSTMWTKTLLEAGSEVSIKDSLGYTPLLDASNNLYGPPEIIRLLLEFGADPNEENEFGSALHHAAERGRLESIEYLLQRGANPFTRGKSGLYYNSLPFQVSNNVKHTSRTLEWMNYLFSHLSENEQNLVNISRRITSLSSQLKNLAKQSE